MNRTRAKHIAEPGRDDVAMCGVPAPATEMVDVHDGIAECRTCMRECDNWWRAEEATWDQ